MVRCESRTSKKTGCRRIHIFELWCWRIFMRDPWSARRSNWAILKEISPDYSLEGLMLNLKCQYFGHLMAKSQLIEKDLNAWENLKAGGEGGDRGWDDWMASRTQWTWVWAYCRRLWNSRKPGMLQSMGSQRIWHNLATEQQHCFTVLY